MAHLNTIEVRSRSRNELIDITPQVQKVVRDSGVRSGHCLLYVPHTTAGITINEGADPSVQKDILTFLSRMVPHPGSYAHLGRQCGFPHQIFTRGGVADGHHREWESRPGHLASCLLLRVRRPQAS